MTNDHLQRQRTASDKRALFGNMLHASKREAAIFFLDYKSSCCLFLCHFVCIIKGSFFLALKDWNIHKCSTLPIVVWTWKEIKCEAYYFTAVSRSDITYVKQTISILYFENSRYIFLCLNSNYVYQRLWKMRKEIVVMHISWHS